MESWDGLLIQIITAFVGIFITSISIVGGFWIKKINHKLKMKTITDEINRYVQWAQQAKSFKLMATEDQKQAVLESIQQFALENEIAISPTELTFLIERSIQSLVKFEMAGLRLKQSKSASMED